MTLPKNLLQGAEYFMKQALKEAKKAMLLDEVPVGCVIVKDNKIIARAHNKKEAKQNATAHAEIEAINKASKKLNNWHLDGADIYVTLEPCPMCAGAMINSRIGNLYFGAWEPKFGACGSIVNLFENAFNHKINFEGGILAEECALLLKNFFKNKRKTEN
jgi:tRNA(adenine34) deaminase